MTSPYVTEKHNAWQGVITASSLAVTMPHRDFSIFLAICL